MYFMRCRLSNPRQLGKLAGLALLCTACHSIEGRAAATPNKSASKEIQNAATPIRTTTPSPSPKQRFAEREIKQVDYAKEDLEAQQRMAWWTRVMGFAAIVSIFLSSAGIGLIYITFRATNRAARYAGIGARETRKANKATIAAVEASRIANDASNEANRIAEAANRPWIELRVEQHEPPKPLPDRMAQVSYKVFMKNLGKTPALELRSAEFKERYDSIEFEEKLFKVAEEAKARTYSRPVLFPNQEVQVSGFGGPEFNDTAYYVAVAYKTSGSDSDFVTSVIFNVMHETSEGQLFGTAETGNLTTPVTIGDRQAAFIT